MEQWLIISPWIAGLGIGVMLFCMLKLAKSTNLIKDLSIKEPKPFSLASSQLFWWTAIILSCFIWKGMQDLTLPKLNSTALLLLGISVATTLTGKVIDNTDRNIVFTNRHQDRLAAKNFFKDILSDGQGNYSIHRLQTLLFNIIIGMLYITEFAKTSAFPDWDNSYISALLGISNAGYIAIKNTENADSKVQPIGNAAIDSEDAKTLLVTYKNNNTPAETIISATR